MAYIGNSPDTIQRGRRFIYEFTATAGQTVFSGADDNNQTLDLLEANEQSVFLNGVRLIPTDDYTVSGDTLTLTSAASLNDFLVVETQAEVANISTYTRAESDARYVNYNGDIISGDLQITGNVSVASGNISLGDNDKAIFGTSLNLEIYGNGGYSYIDEVGANNLNIRTNGANIGIYDTANSQYMAKFTTAGDAELYYNGAEKLATTSAGINVTGTVTADGLTVDGNGSLLTLDNGSNPATISNTNGNVTLDFDTTNAGRNYIIQGNNLNIFRASTGGDISFYEDTGATVKFFWDASAESLGIGTSSPALPLDVVANSGANALSLRTRGLNDYSFLQFRSNDGTEDLGGPAIYRSAASTSNLLFYTANGGAALERMRIDSNGNLLVGTTTTTFSDDGVRLWNYGSIEGVRANNAMLYLNRRSSDGDIAVFNKDGTAVGSIGTFNGDTVIGTGQAAFRFNDGIPSVAPHRMDTNNVADNLVDLGYSSGRWKDLYLSGGVYVGGTGSANYLDDYEEGTWTPTFGSNAGGANSGAVYSEQVGTYTKIGNRVICNFKITTTSKGTIGGSTARIFGWPFNSSATSITGKVAFENVGVSAVDWRPRGMYGSPLLTLDYKTSASGNYVEAAATTFWTDTSSCWGYVSYFIS